MDNRSKSKLTVVMIPDVTRPVRKTRISRKLLYIIPAIVIVMIIVIWVWQADRYKHFASNIVRLTSQLQDDQSSYEQIISQREQTIQLLYDELQGLARRAEAMQEELEQLKDLEQELRQLTDLPPLEHVSDNYSPSERVQIAALGGLSHTVSHDELRQLIEDTEQAIYESGERMQELNEALLEAREAALEEQKRLRHTPSIWPVKSRDISSGYGYRRDPFSRLTSFHSGIDIAAKLNTDVVATADGVVELSGKDSQKGNYILINHSYGMHTQYMHLNKLYVSKGDSVEKGQVIGSVGSTGRSTGPHVHYEVWKQRKVVNPTPYLSGE